jgi:transcriptional regulator GlxA family with amidase domain
MKTIAIIVFDNFTDIDAFLAWDLFHRLPGIGKEWQVKFLGDKPVHTSVTGVELRMHGLVEESREAEIVFFSSGRGTRDLYRNEAYLRRFHLDPQRQIVCSMCSGALILAGLGLLEGLTATTYPTTIKDLRAMGVEVLDDQHLVTHGNIGTAAGCLAAVDLVSWCVTRTVGAEAAERVVAAVQPVGKGQVCSYG